MEARILGPAMLKQGFSRGFSCAVIAVGSLITADDPPSIGLILYGFLGNVSIGKFFIGGVIPGLLMTDVPPDGHDVGDRDQARLQAGRQFPGFRELLRELNYSKWALLFRSSS